MIELDLVPVSAWMDELEFKGWIINRLDELRWMDR